MKRLHIAISVSDIARSVKDYSRRLEKKPDIIIPGKYALWRTRFLNFSIRRVASKPGVLRHLGWEDSSVSRFTKEKDVNGIVWERFSPALQAKEIVELWGKRKP